MKMRLSGMRKMVMMAYYVGMRQVAVGAQRGDGKHVHQYKPSFKPHASAENEMRLTLRRPRTPETLRHTPWDHSHR